jgi:hypothetical protein
VWEKDFGDADDSLGDWLAIEAYISRIKFEVMSWWVAEQVELRPQPFSTPRNDGRSFDEKASRLLVTRF